MSRDLRPDELPGEPEPQGPRLTPTTAPVMAASAVAGMLIGFGIVWAFADRVLPVTPWTMSTLLAVLGVVALLAARTLRARLARARGAVSNDFGVLAFVAGRTLLLVGLLLAGGHLAYAVSQLGQLSRPLPRQRLIWAAVAVVCSGVMALGGAMLERAAWLGTADDDRDRSD